MVYCFKKTRLCGRQNGIRGRNAHIPLNCKYVMWQRDSADERKVTHLKIGRFLGFSRCLHSKHLRVENFSEAGKRGAGRHVRVQV